MKKINSIGYGHKILCGAGVCLIILPVIFHLLSAMTGQMQLQLLAKGFLVLGSILLLFLFLLLRIEFYQDKKIDQYYSANSRSRLPLKSGLFECQTCGNNQVKPEQRSCAVCGINFKNWSEDDGNRKMQ